MKPDAATNTFQLSNENFVMFFVQFHMHDTNNYQADMNRTKLHPPHRDDSITR